MNQSKIKKIKRLTEKIVNKLPLLNEEQKRQMIFNVVKELKNKPKNNFINNNIPKGKDKCKKQNIVKQM